MNKKEVLESLFLRNPLLRPQNLHYRSKILRNRTSQPPKPLSYPLHPPPSQSELITKPLGPLIPLPFNVHIFCLISL